MTVTAPERLCIQTPERWHQNHELWRQIIREGPEALAQILGQWLIYRYTEQDNQRRLELVVSPKGQPAVTLTRKPDGTLEAGPDGGGRKLLDNVRMEYWRKAAEENMYIFAGNLLIRWAEERYGDQDLFHHQMKFMPWGKGEDNCGIQVMIKETVHGVLNGAEENGAPWPRDRKKNNTRLLKLLRAKMIDEEVRLLARTILPPGNIHAYNHAVINAPTIHRMSNDSPHVLMAYHRLIARKQEDDTPPFTMGQVTAEVKQLTGLDGAAWRLFCAHGLPESAVDTDSIASHAAVAYNNLTEANCPQAAHRLMKLMSKEMLSHKFFTAANWQAGAARAAWIHLLGITLRRSITAPYLWPDIVNPEAHMDAVRLNPGYIEYSMMKDHLRACVQEQLPWPLANYQTTLDRATRWHTDQRGTTTQEQNQALARRTWTTPLNHFTHQNGLRATAVLTGLDLHQAAADLDNCLNRFVDQCQNGTSQIYLLSEADDPPTGAVSLESTGDHWTIAQVQLASNQPADDRHLAAATALAVRFNEVRGRRR